MGEAERALKVCLFWLSILWIPVVGFALIGYSGGLVPIAGVVVPISAMIFFGVCTCLTCHASGMMAEDAAKGDASLVRGVLRASTSSLTGERRPSKEDLGSGSTDSLNVQPVQIGAGEPFAEFGVWQVQMDAGDWVDFPQEQQDDFNRALTHGLAEVEFTHAKQRYKLIFGRDSTNAVQENLRTGKCRPARCVDPGQVAPAENPALDLGAPTAVDPLSPPDSPTRSITAMSNSNQTWQVQMDSGRWITMAQSANMIINDAQRKSQPSAFFRDHAQDYELIFDTSVQRNLKTGKERPVRINPDT